MTLILTAWLILSLPLAVAAGRVIRAGTGHLDK